MSPAAATHLAAQMMTCDDVDQLLDRLHALLATSEWRRDDTSRFAVLTVAWRLTRVAMRDATAWHYVDRLSRP